jgi:hypothetical protein
VIVRQQLNDSPVPTLEKRPGYKQMTMLYIPRRPAQSSGFARRIPGSSIANSTSARSEHPVVRPVWLNRSNSSPDPHLQGGASRNTWLPTGSNQLRFKLRRVPLADKLSKRQELQCRSTSRSSTPLPGKPPFVEACADRLPDAHCTWPSWGAMRAVSHRAEIELQVPFNDKKRIASSSR